jgi:hypothetical protein
MGQAVVRIIALGNGSGELQSCDRNRNEQCKDFFHGDSSFFCFGQPVVIDRV